MKPLSVYTHGLSKFISLLIIFVIAILIFDILAHKIDYTRVIYKRLKADSPYIYERVDPSLMVIDPSSKLNKQLTINFSKTRQSLITALWGNEGFPAELLPQKFVSSTDAEMLGITASLDTVHQLTLQMELGFHSNPVYLSRSPEANRLIIYHHGFGEAAHKMRALFLELMNEGFDLIVLYPLGHGHILNPAYGFPTKDSKALANIFHQMSSFDRPYRYHLNPIFASMNHALKQKDYKSIDIIGFSMGAYLAVVVAALDPRIERSYPIAGAYPAYIRVRNEVMPDGPPSYKPMLSIASSLDLFVLGAIGKNRKQVQIYNRYDRCCFNGLRGTLYEPDVQDMVRQTRQGGSFSVMLDESHADHKISNAVIEFLISDLSRP
ncbi:MAG: hypothetical protein CMM32_00915 [Rhodospirillaceae bacterium]|nr:hypothetical protein [Rhodospirillaceae bacterium]|tara:strand:- start:101 stop:1237 length:1137 start_codon:yes stop_codon:yes gene_type:complete